MRGAEGAVAIGVQLDLRRQQVTEVLVDLGHVGGGDAEHAEVTEEVVDYPQLATLDLFLLGPAITDGEEHVLGHRYDVRLGSDGRARHRGRRR